MWCCDSPFDHRSVHIDCSRSSGACRTQEWWDTSQACASRKESKVCRPSCTLKRPRAARRTWTIWLTLCTTWVWMAICVMWSGKSAQRETRSLWASNPIQSGRLIAMEWSKNPRFRKYSRLTTILTSSYVMHYNVEALPLTRPVFWTMSFLNAGPKQVLLEAYISLWKVMQRSAWNKYIGQQWNPSSTWWGRLAMEFGALARSSLLRMLWRKPCDHLKFVFVFNGWKEDQNVRLLRWTKRRLTSPRRKMRKLTKRWLQTCRIRSRTCKLRKAAHPKEKERAKERWRWSEFRQVLSAWALLHPQESQCVMTSIWVDAPRRRRVRSAAKCGTCVCAPMRFGPRTEGTWQCLTVQR